jgi:hypothetical protein
LPGLNVNRVLHDFAQHSHAIQGSLLTQQLLNFLPYFFLGICRCFHDISAFILFSTVLPWFAF